MVWEIVEHPAVRAWRESLSTKDLERVSRAFDALADLGPALGRPLVDRLYDSEIHNLKELRIGGSAGSAFRVLFVFDPKRKAVLLVAGDKKGKWESWYRTQINLAESRYLDHLNQNGPSGD